LVPKARKFNLAVQRGEITEAEVRDEVKKGRISAEGHRLTRGLPIGKGALQLREAGAWGMVFPTQTASERLSNIIGRISQTIRHEESTASANKIDSGEWNEDDLEKMA
jgi:hypothetical protein